jgi:hypothetical protein
LFSHLRLTNGSIVLLEVIVGFKEENMSLRRAAVGH